MCGIFGVLAASSSATSDSDAAVYRANLQRIVHRGPDDTQFVQRGRVTFGFHRLAINDLTASGNQPLAHPERPELLLVCNGEIYNHRELRAKYDFKPRSGSDCEIILWMYARFGIAQTLAELDGYFAFLLLDGDTLLAARDDIGVRPLFVGERGGSTFFASEVKAIHELCDTIVPFAPGTWWSSADQSTSQGQHNFSTLWAQPMRVDELAVARSTVRRLLEDAVRKRVETTERPIGCLLSGGLDSSVICALVSRALAGRPLHTFSIGLEGSTDVKFARIVAAHLGTVHHEVIVTEQDMLNAIPAVVKAIESYDTTSVRASTPMYLLCQHIAQNTDIRVIFSGEGSDELSGSYLYFHNAPSPEAFYDETVRLVRDLHYFDVLRCDRAVAAHGLEVRVPFLDRAFMQYYLHLDPRLKQPAAFGIEKFLLRDACRDLLPASIVDRTKAAFSDAVSDPDRSWFQIIQERVAELVASGALDTTLVHVHNAPQLDETRWYRALFDDAYPGRAELIPYLWLPRWSGAHADPSARTLDIYKTVGGTQ